MLSKIPVIWQLAVVQFELGTAINGVALAEIYPSTYPDKFFNHQTVGVIRSYANKLYAGKKLFIKTDKEVHTVTTQNNGQFGLWLNGDRINNIEIYDDVSCNIRIPVIQLYPVYFPLANQSIAIISDIDDTILYSFTKAFFRRIYTILLKRPKNRKIVDFTRHLLSYARKSGFRVYCVSKSEMNLFHLLTNIFSLNGIGDSIVYLFDYLTYSGLFTRKGKHFKLDQISSILQKSPGNFYYLVGDDTEADIRTYSEVARQFPGRICQVFIRKTKAYKLRFQKSYYQRLHTLGIPVLYFDETTVFDGSMLKNINR
ncbi:MAG TPA: phosphatase domain-containing protein [Puia sp.]|nr:phosphatase domain-containing protein [Puia sp.]